MDIINYYYKETGVPIYLLDLKEKALFGFRSAIGFTTQPPENVIAWDCGAGFFQFSC
jgi:hypothetical protein